MLYWVQFGGPSSCFAGEQTEYWRYCPSYGVAIVSLATFGDPGREFPPLTWRFLGTLGASFTSLLDIREDFTLLES